jgi:hypothetical protein
MDAGFLRWTNIENLLNALQPEMDAGRFALE